MVGVIEGFRWCIWVIKVGSTCRAFRSASALRRFFFGWELPSSENGKELRRPDLSRPHRQHVRYCHHRRQSLEELPGRTRAARNQSYTALRDVIGREVRNFARKTADFIGGRPIVQGDTVEEFWALKDVSFEVKQGEILGIVGRNGAGRARCSRCSAGSPSRHAVDQDQRAHWQPSRDRHRLPPGDDRTRKHLSQWRILGMTKADISRKFDEIVAFAGVETFLDTPVKRYSSGMYVRLAFAVAAHLDVDILNRRRSARSRDAEFQRKCLGN